MQGKPKPDWIYKKVYVEIDTGEILKKDIEENYIIIKTIKNVNYNRTRTGGIITYTNLVRRKARQQKFNFG